jgi:quercetin dioxygenase-like cupin family protein
MDKNEFDAQLRADGYSEIETKSVAPKPANDAHGHAFAVRGLVLSGAFTIIQDGTATTYMPGEVFMVVPGCKHSEEVGAEGAQILVGRKY